VDESTARGLEYLGLITGRLREVVSSEEADPIDEGDSLGTTGGPLGTYEQ
jgi:hypothetical protein